MDKKSVLSRKLAFFRLQPELDKGFTLIEVVVVTAIISVLSGVVLYSFTGLSEGGSLNRSARELALNIRKAQNFSLVVTEIPVGDPPVLTLPPAVGIEFTVNKSSYQMFADLDSPTPRDFKYSGSSEKMGDAQTFYRNTQVSALNTSAGPVSKLNIIFTAPEASMILTQTDGSPITGNKADIVLQAPTTGQIRTITVRTSGQITIK